MEFFSRIFTNFFKKSACENREGHGDDDDDGGHAPVVVLEEEVSLADKVFGNDLIREIIVDHAIHEDGGDLNRSTVCSLRALGKGWNDSVCKILHKRGKALFKIYVGRGIYFNNVERDKPLLDRFTETFGHSSDILGRVPTYDVTILEESIPMEYYEGLRNFLRACGQGFVKLEAHMNWNGGLLHGIFRDIPLQSLQQASVNFVEINEDIGIGQRESVSNFLHWIFSGAHNLQHLDMYNDDVLPTNLFKFTTLSSTLRVIAFQDIGNADLEKLLVNTSLPNLADLSLGLTRDFLSVGLLEGILGNVRKSLKEMCIQGHFEHEDEARDPVLFRFPKMEKLTVFSLFSNRYHLEHGMRSLETYLPKLRVLELDDHSWEMLGRWTNFSSFSTVQNLYISSLNDNLDFDTKTMKRIHLVFPNVTKLRLEFVEIPASGLQFIFKEMSNLVELHLDLTDRLEPDEDTIPPDWDALLLGVTGEVSAWLRAAPLPLEKIQINNDDDPSIMKLTELRTLVISEFFYTEEHSVSLLSDVAFHYAFMKMSGLQNLNFCGRFSISSEMKDKWRMTGRLLSI